MTFGIKSDWLRFTALVCTALLVPGDIPLLAQQPAPAAGADAPKVRPADQLDSLVAPIALYPDPLLAQVLAASTYPLEIVQCQRWLKENSKLTGENLTKAAAKQPWDASVQALVAFPDALKFLDQNIPWMTDLGNAFLEQQGDVMDAVQRMRKKAKDGGKLASTKEQKVEVKTVETKTIIQIVPSDPQVIYVPSYQPTVVYGAPVYAYPPVVYPTGAVVATAAVSFGVGVMMGAMWGGCCGGGGYGWGANWGGNNININNNFNTRYNYNNVQGGNRTNIQGGNRVNNVGSGNNQWQHNPQHRQSVPYSNNSTANKFGGSSRDASGRTQSNNRAGQTRTGQADRSVENRGAQSGASRGQSGSRDKVGDRSIPSSDRSGQNSAFGGSDSRSRSQAASDRGFSSSRQSSGGGSSSAASRSSAPSRSSSGASRSSGGGSRGGGGGGRRR